MTQSTFHSRTTQIFAGNIVSGAISFLMLAKPEYAPYILIPAAFSLGLSTYAIAREKYDKNISHQASVMSHNAEYFKPLAGVMVAIGAATVAMQLGHVKELTMAPLALGTFLNSLFTTSWMSRINLQKMPLFHLISNKHRLEHPSTFFNALEVPLESVTDCIIFPININPIRQQDMLDLFEHIDSTGTIHHEHTHVTLNAEHWHELAPYCLALQLGHRMNRQPHQILKDLQGCRIDTQHLNWFQLLHDEYQVTGSFQNYSNEHLNEGVLHF